MYSFMLRKILSEKLEEFYKSEASSKKTLDVGSRRGRHSKYFSNVVSIDINANNDPDLVADAHALPFADNTFEVVLCREVLEHVRHPETVVRELHRVLVPGGTLLLTTRFLFPIHEAPDDRWRFTRYVLEEIFTPWTTTSISEETQPMTAVACLLQRLAWQSDFRFLNRPVKVCLLVLAWFFSKLDVLVLNQYGDVRKESRVQNAFTTGYYVKATK
jgi:SAM-dependent methyltransferase